MVGGSSSDSFGLLATFFLTFIGSSSSSDDESSDSLFLTITFLTVVDAFDMTGVFGKILAGGGITVFGFCVGLDVETFWVCGSSSDEDSEVEDSLGFGFVKTFFLTFIGSSSSSDDESSDSLFLTITFLTIVDAFDVTVTGAFGIILVGAITVFGFCVGLDVETFLVCGSSSDEDSEVEDSLGFGFVKTFFLT